MAKKVQAYVKLQVAAGMANRVPSRSKLWVSQGRKLIMEFCKAFSAKTGLIEKVADSGSNHRYADRSFTAFVTRNPVNAVLAEKRLSNKVTSSGKPNKDKVGKISALGCGKSRRPKLPT